MMKTEQTLQSLNGNYDRKSDSKEHLTDQVDSLHKNYLLLIYKRNAYYANIPLKRKVLELRASSIMLRTR